MAPQGDPEYLVPVSLAIGSAWPSDLFELIGATPIETLLDGIGISRLAISQPALISATAVFPDELTIALPAVAGFMLVFGGDGERTEVNVELALADPFELRIMEFPIRLRFPRSIFKPVERRNGEFTAVSDASVEIGTNVTMTFDGEGNIAVMASEEIAISPFMIGDSGVVIEAEGVKLCLSASEPPPSLDLAEGWRGVFIERARVHLRGVPVLPGDVVITNCSIGSGGFSGEVEVTWPSDPPPPTVDFFGVDLSLTGLHLGFDQNALTASKITGTITLPFFEKPVAVEIGVDLAGTFLVKLTGGVDDDDQIGENGLLTLTKRNLFTLTVESLGFEIKNGEFAAKLAGTIQPLVAHIDWPALKIKELTIHADGRVDLDGGWLKLPEQHRLDFHGFSAELTQIGFGETDDGYRWIGFSGGIQLVADLALGAKFDHLRIEWPRDGPINIDTIRLSLEGIRVDLTIPDVLAFKGTVRFINDTEDPDPAKHQHGFKGGVKLTLYPINLEIDAEILVIKTEGFTAFYIYVNTDFPAGIPLASTGIALYGLAGLVGQNVAPNKTDQELWYENWYKGKRLQGDEQDPGVAASVKWDPLSGSMAFGAGVTVGTVSDNGFAVNGKLLLVLILPGPIILLEGRANLLTERSKLGGTSEPTFEALAVLDGRAGQFLLNVAAQYKKDDAGHIIDIRAGAEAFFDYHRADAWHLYLGQDEPREKRIRAAVLSLFHADAYFMLSGRDLRMGFWVGFEERWGFGPLAVGLSAWISADAAVSWKPVHIHGELQLHGGFELKAFGFGVSLEVDARIAADAPTPFHIEADLRVKLALPWPLPDLKANVGLEWGEAGAPIPPVPLALGAASCEHLSASEKWPLDRWPRYDAESPDGPGFWNEDAPEDVDETEILSTIASRAYDEDEKGRDPAFVGVPLVPLDVRPVLSFAKPVFDDVGFGHKREGLVEQVGESSFEYHLVRLELDRKRSRDDEDWEVVAVRSENRDEETARDKLRGTWQLVNGGNDALPNTKLMLWSKTTYDWAREQAGPMHWTWTQGQMSDAFCPPPSPAITRCVHWDAVPNDTRYAKPFVRERLTFGLESVNLHPASLPMDVAHRPRAVYSRVRALRLPYIHPNTRVRLTIKGFPYGTTRVTLNLETPAKIVASASYKGNTAAPNQEKSAGLSTVTLQAEAIDTVVVETNVAPDKSAYLYRVCFTAPLNPDRQQAVLEWVTSVDETRQTWHSTDNLLQPDSYYRLTVATRVLRNGEEVKHDPFTEYIYFKTGQPPGADPVLLGADDSGESTVNNQHEHFPGKGPLKDLRRYVDYTVPAAEARAVYRAYDIGAYFNQNYVDAMYQLAGKPLKVFLHDAKGELVGNVNNQWGQNPVLTLTHTETQWLYDLDRTTCLDNLGLTDLPMDRHINASGAGLLLRAEALYEARLVADGTDGGDGRQYPVYKWRFITSRFAHFRHHIGSFRDQVWDEHILRGEPETALLTAGQLARLETLVAAERDGTASPASDPTRFEEIAFLFGFGTQPQGNLPGCWLRPAPRAVDVTLLRDGTRRYGVLIESPEPLDRDRVTIAARYYSGNTTPLPHPAGVAKLFEARVDPAGKQYVDILLQQDLDLTDWRIEHTASAEGDHADFSPCYTFPADSVFKEGSVIRVHRDDLSLQTTGDRLRLVDALGNTIHSRFFLQAQRYMNQEITAIWNTDRTAAFLFFSADEQTVGPLPDGQYRLSCIFRRNVAGQPQLKQENQTTDEAANLDFVITANS